MFSAILQTKRLPLVESGYNKSVSSHFLDGMLNKFENVLFRDSDKTALKRGFARFNY